MPLDREYYEKIINFVLFNFKEIFGADIVFIKKQVAIEHMGHFLIQYKYTPLNYEILFENDRNAFSIEIIDSEGAKNLLYRIEKYDNTLSNENIQNALLKLKSLLSKNNMTFYIYRDDKLYKKINGKYLRVKDLNELR